MAILFVWLVDSSNARVQMLCREHYGFIAEYSVYERRVCKMFSIGQVDNCMVYKLLS